MNGKEILELLPNTITQNAKQQNISRLELCKDKSSFINELKEMAKSCKPCWIYGYPRTGSSWLCRHFFGQFTKSEFLEPFDLFQCSSVSSISKDFINLGTPFKNIRPEITKHLELFKAPADRIILATHDSFVFKFLFDFNIVSQLLNLFPNSLFIWILRDARDSIESNANPKPDHWPPPDLSYLGENEKSRFEGALLRWIEFTLHQLKVFDLFKDRILIVKYENFSKDFKKTGKNALDFSKIPYKESSLDELQCKFKARHGLWKEWDNWKKDFYLDIGAQKLNKMFGYESGAGNSQNVWEEALIK
jgi:hypothetical protein